MSRVSFGEADLSALRPRFQPEGERLVIAFDATGARNKLDELMPYDLSSKVSGSLEGGATFEVGGISGLHRGGGFSATDGAYASMTIEADNWTVLDGKTPSIWAGRLEGLGKLSFGGNLIVERVEPGGIPGGRRGHFRLSGAYLYYLVRSVKDGGWHLAIDTGGAGIPDEEQLGRDLLALQFVLGRQLRLPLLLGLSADRRSVACVARSALRKHLEDGSHPPVPIESNNEDWIDEAWAALFFDRISAKWRQHPKMNMIFWMALDMYLDAMRNYLDADYMRLHIALEAFAYALLKTDDEERVEVKDRKSWKAWVKENEGAIRGHATEGRHDALYNKVMAASRLSSGKVVPTAFSECGLALTGEMEQELAGRDLVIHQGLMSPDGYDPDRDLRRVGLVRTMLVALVAKTVGYGGAINGWEVGRLGRAVEPVGWWSVDEADRQQARAAFVAQQTT